MAEVWITGSSLPALQVALDLAEVGLPVVIQRSDDPGDPVEAELDHDGAVAALLTRVAAPLPGHGDDETADAAPVFVLPKMPWLVDREGVWSAPPTPQVWGIPAVVLSEPVIGLVGAGAAWRAFRDRIAPLMTIGKTRSLGVLVRKRLGARVLARLVDPVVVERYGVPAVEVDVAIAAPGLNEALTRAGSLSAAALAYSDRHVQRETRVEPGGGWAALRRLLEARLSNYGVRFVSSGELDASIERHRSEAAVDAPVGEKAPSIEVVHDVPSDVRLPALLTEAEGRSVAPVRLYAEIDIEPVAGLPAPGVALVGALAVRVWPTADGRWRARCSSVSTSTSTPASTPTPAPIPGLLQAAGSGSAPVAAVDAAPTRGNDRFANECADALQQLGVVAIPAAEWEITRRAAPIATVAARDALLRAQASGENPGEIPAEAVRGAARGAGHAVGRALAGDDLSMALAQAHELAVHLRRRLLGLTDE